MKIEAAVAEIGNAARLKFRFNQLKIGQVLITVAGWSVTIKTARIEAEVKHLVEIWQRPLNFSTQWRNFILKKAEKNPENGRLTF